MPTPAPMSATVRKGAEEPPAVPCLKEAKLVDSGGRSTSLPPWSLEASALSAR